MSKSKLRPITFLLPGKSGYRTIFKQLQAYIQKNLARETNVIDSRKLQKNEFQKILQKNIQSTKKENRPECIFFTHHHLIPGLHHTLQGVSGVMFADYQFKKSSSLNISQYRKLSNPVFLRLQKKEKEHNQWIKSLSAEERVKIGLHWHYNNISSFQKHLHDWKEKNNSIDQALEKYLKEFYTEYGKHYVNFVYGWRVFQHAMVHTYGFSSQLMYNELVRLKAILLWSKRVSGGGWSLFPKLKSRIHNILPFMPIPQKAPNPTVKLKGKRFVIFVREAFNSEGELSLLYLLDQLPKNYTVDLIGTNRVTFLKEIHERPDRKKLGNLAPRIRFHQNIPRSNLEKILKEAFFSLKFSHQGTNNMAVFEALAYGIPMISSNNRIDKGILLHRKNSFTVKTPRLLENDIRQISKLIRSFEKNPKNYEKMSRCAYKTAKSFDIKVWAPRILKWAGIKIPKK